MKRITLFKLIVFCALVFMCSSATQLKSNSDSQEPNEGLIVPSGFKVVKIADGLGSARHLIVTPQGNIYVRLARPVNGAGTLMLREQGDSAVVKTRFGNFGGTGVHLYNGYLYTASNSEIFRYKLNNKEEIINPQAPERIVTGLIDKGTHETKSIMTDDAGNMYIPIGCPSNSCQVQDRQKGSMGQPGCPLLELTGGVWKFSPDKKDQTYADGIRYATGLRNVVAVDWNKQTRKLYVMQHGRDQLNNLFPDLYTVKQSAELPSECMYELSEGANAGWPYIYYDHLQHKKILAPEYGGDGKKEGNSEFIDPVAAYPGHLAPNDILFYTGNLFPERYKNGAFIAFHGSWNRSPEPQAGCFVIFQPFKNGKPFGNWEVFADGFSGSPENTASGRAERRPCGLAQGPDGSLYVCDDIKGGVYKITYSKNFTSASAKKVEQKKITPPVPTRSQAAVPPALKNAMISGQKVYTDNCAVCHQADGRGVQNLNPPLNNTSYVKGDKATLINVILKGRLSQKKVDGQSYSNAMPPLKNLTDKEIADVLTYVRKSFGNKSSQVTQAEVAAVRKKDQRQLR